MPMEPLQALLAQQRRVMQGDALMGATRARLAYVMAGAAGLAGAAFIVPRLAPWMP